MGRTQDPISILQKFIKDDGSPQVNAGHWKSPHQAGMAEAYRKLTMLSHWEQNIGSVALV